MLIKKNKFINNNREFSNIMNNYFTEITKHLHLKLDKISHSQPLENIVVTFQIHESIWRVKLAKVQCNEVCKKL